MEFPASDESLMRAYQNGDSAAFEAIYHRYSANVMTFLRKRIQSKPDQDEIFQRVFLKFHRNRHAYDAKYPLLQWLYVITKSELLDFLKSEKSSQKHQSRLEAESLSQNSEAPSLNTVEVAGMEKLDAIQREVVSLRVLQESSFSEIASKLQRSEANIRQILSRALKRLRQEGNQG